MSRTSRHTTAAALVSLVVAVLGTAFAAPATAVTTSTAGAALAADHGASRSITAAENARALGYWTPERMRASQTAEPGLRSGTDAPAAQVERGAPLQVRPGTPTAAATAAAGSLAPTPATTDGKAAATGTTTSATTAATTGSSEGFWQASNTANPNAQIGRLFYQSWDPVTRTWKNYNCSGTVVNSENKSVVWTAGHCVFETYTNTWNRNYTFCPGYRNGSCPFGAWTAATQHTTTQWQSSVCAPGVRCLPAEFAYDFGALKMNRYNGYRIADWVGAHGIQFNGATYQYRYAFGYPLNKANGQYLYHCSGANTVANGNLQIACTAGGGASGGPWLSQVNNAWLGVVHSVNSHGGSTWMGGPYQGAVAQNLYASVRY